MTFPVNDQFCTLIAGGLGNMVVGLSNVDGVDALRNQTNVLGVFTNNTWYKVRLLVTDDKIQAWINSENQIDFEHKNHNLTIRPLMKVATPFGISAGRALQRLKTSNYSSFQNNERTPPKEIIITLLAF